MSNSCKVDSQQDPTAQEMVSSALGVTVKSVTAMPKRNVMTDMQFEWCCLGVHSTALVAAVRYTALCIDI
jgi:hypothetical protein